MRGPSPAVVAAGLTALAATLPSPRGPDAPCGRLRSAMETGARVDLCGRLRLTLAGASREDALRGRQGRLLLAFLVLHRHRPVRRDELVEALWAAEGVPPSESALSPVVSRLRLALAPGDGHGPRGAHARAA